MGTKNKNNGHKTYMGKNIIFKIHYIKLWTYQNLKKKRIGKNRFYIINFIFWEATLKMK